MKKVYSGYLELRHNPNDDDPYLEEHCQIYVSSMERPLCDLIKEDIKIFGNFLSVRYFISEEEKKIYQLEERLINFISGIGEAKYENIFGDWTGYLWTNEKLKVGGHDLLAVFKNYIEKYLYLEITFHKDRPQPPEGEGL